MRKIFIFLIIFLITPSLLFAKNNFIEINFFNSSFEIISDSQGFSIPFIDGFSNINTYYERMLPRKNIDILLPPNAKCVSFYIKDLKISKIESKIILPNGDFPIKGVNQNDIVKEDIEIEIDKPIYLLSENNKKGFRFLTFSYYPFLYSNEKLSFVKSFKLIINYTIEKIEEDIYSIDDVENFLNFREIYPMYQKKIKEEKYDYLIITIDSLRKLLDDHKNYLESKGVQTKIVNLSSIPKIGKDLPERIRNYLKDEYKNYGFKYLLLVGSVDSIPMRVMYAGEKNEDNETKYIPSDFYYSDLTSDWDSNKDGFYGEPDIDRVDFYPEISVGRIPFDTENEAKIVLLKTRLFMDKTYLEYKKKVLFLGAYFTFKGEDGRWGVDTDGGYINDQIYKIYLQGKGFIKKSLNELQGYQQTVVKNYTDDQISIENFVKYKNNFLPGIVSWVGHGSWNATARKIWAYDFDGNEYPTSEEIKWDDFINNSSVHKFKASEPSIFLSSSCLNLYPEKDSLGKNTLKSSGVAFVGYSRSSWYFPNLAYYKFEENPSMYSLNAIIIKNLASNLSIGESLSKTISWYYDTFYTNFTSGRAYLAHNIYCLNLFGEPIIGLFSFNDVSIKPKIINTVPSNNQEDVSINSIIKVQFDRNIDKSLVNSKNIIVQEGFNLIQGKIEYKESEFSIIFTPANELKKGTIYSVTIKKDIKDLNGNSLEKDYKFSFKTISSIEDFINQFFDKDESYKIDLKSCSIKVEKDYLTFKLNSFRNWGDPNEDFRILIYLEVDNNINTGWLKDDDGNGEDYLIWIGTYEGKFYSDINYWDSISKSWKWIEDLISNVPKNSNEAWVKIPKKYFKFNQFGFWIGIKDVKNDEFDYYPNDEDPNYYVYFNLTSEPRKLKIVDYFPKNNSIVKTDCEIYVQFSNNLLESTLNKDSFIVKKGTRIVEGNIIYDNKTYILKFIPNSLLEGGSNYQVILNKVTTDINGNSLGEDFIFNFQTEKDETYDYILQYISPRGYFKTVDISKVYILFDTQNLSFKIETYDNIKSISNVAFIIRMDVDNNQSTGVPIYPYGGNGEDYSVYLGSYNGMISSFIMIWNKDKWEIKEEIKNFFFKENINYINVTVPISKIGNPKEINYWIGSTDDPSKFPIVDIVPENKYFLNYQIVGKKGWIKQFDDYDEGYIYDLKSTYMMHDETNIYFKVETYRSFSDVKKEKFFIQINIDADQNSLTGKPSPGMGEDFIINVGYSQNDNRIVGELWIWEEDRWYVYENLQNYKIENNSNFVEVNLIKSLIGNPDKFNYWVGVGSWLDENEFDYYPNDDDPFYYIEYDSKKINILDALTLSVDLPDNFITNKDTILVKGKTNNNAVLKINDEEIVVSSSGYFAKVVTLKLGENLISIKAFDNSGNKKEVTKKVIYSISQKNKIIIELFIDKKVAKINGESCSLDAAPFIKNGRTLVPIRFIAEAFGATVQWDGINKTVTIILDSKGIKIILRIDNEIALVNNKEMTLDVPPTIKENRTFVPLRFIAEAFGSEVQWDPNEKKVTILYYP